MMKNLIKTLSAFVLLITFASCTTLNQSMREPNVRVNLNKADFTLSDQVTAEATTTKILGIDFKRLFKKEMGNVQSPSAAISLSSIPVVGNIVTDKTSNYALYELMQKNPGYDVVFYPQYETKKVTSIFITTTTVKVTARLGKLNK